MGGPTFFMMGSESLSNMEDKLMKNPSEDTCDGAYCTMVRCL